MLGPKGYTINMSGEEGKSNSIDIAYVGKDMSYFKDVKERFESTYEEQKFKFRALYADDPKDLKSLQKEIIHSNERIIFIDYSLNSPEMLRLAYALRTEWSTKDRLVVGLLSSLDSRRYLLNSLSLGIQFHYVKGLEISGIVHSCMAVVYPDIVKDMDYAKADVAFDAEAVTTLQIGFLTDRYIHIESNFNFPVDTELFLKTSFFLPVPLSDYYKVVRIQDRNLYTVCDHSFDLEYVHLASAEIDKAEKKVAEFQAKAKKDPKDKNLQFEVSSWESELEAARKKAKEDAKLRGPGLREWIFENESKSRPKRTKVLAIDRQMQLLSTNKNLDSFSFAIRLHSTIDQAGQLLYRTYPGIIAFNLDYPHEDGVYFGGDESTDKTDSVKENAEGQETSNEESNTEAADEKSDDYALKANINGIEQLKWLVEAVKSHEGYHPFLMIFNSREDQDILKREIEYNQMLSIKSPLNLEAIEKVASAYAESGGREVTHDPSKQFGNKERRLYFSKYDPQSFAFYGFDLKVTALSEAEMAFSTDVDIPMFTYLYIKYPVKMTLTVVPPSTPLNPPDLPRGHKPYYALINGLGEIEMKNLRKHINDLFFTEKSQKEADDHAEQERLKVEYQERKKREEEEAKLKEAEDSKEDQD